MHNIYRLGKWLVFSSVYNTCYDRIHDNFRLNNFFVEVSKINEIRKIHDTQKMVSYGKTAMKLAGQRVGTAHFSSLFVSTAYNKLHWTL